MAKWYFDEDGDLALLEGKTIGVFGYGNQGRSQALNMRDSGATVIVGSRSDASAEKSREDGFETVPLAEAAKRADILFILVPDEVMPQIFKEHIEPGLEDGNTLVFASGYNVYYKLLVPPKTVDVVMIAPRMIGRGVRDTFVEGTGFPSLVAVEQDATGNAQGILIALAKAVGSTRMGVIESSFEEETVVDIFAEHQSSLHAIRRACEALVEAGCSPEAAILELYASGEMKEEAGYYAQIGLFKQVTLHSRTSQYGQVVYGRPSPETEEAEMEVLREKIAAIKDGRFARQWTKVQEDGGRELDEALEEVAKTPIMQAEDALYKTLGRR